LGVECSDADILDRAAFAGWSANDRAGPQLTHPVKEDNRMVATTIPKYPLPTSPRGNAQTTTVATTAIANLAQKAYNHGFNTCPFPLATLVPVSGCLVGGAGRDHFAASHPAIICAGKSRRTATARSSLESPFSRRLSEVTESFTWKLILQIRWTRRKDWISDDSHQ
jgi:hypothetical protein